MSRVLKKLLIEQAEELGFAKGFAEGCCKSRSQGRDEGVAMYPLKNTTLVSH